ncbi:type I-U CRISPR-associated protein Cas5/Cas6 [Egibacter rhizosphaerae]|uniref:Type I-U CRISPR-associated protein Cas5/Cas6 n=1 Tax=Egibacter rhizosphaerae TaxID=1670831 RepID=A0A411YEG1_9ACTN|nr:type I-U CRISPR-associated protein Csb2 [Egibacter rhizosphaerae]QBI19643.1 type I-U CRISPR-associated protein Cas5/Cas6 [Egibacter rhizosphaerae]
MIAVEVELLHGVLRLAGSDAAVTGVPTTGEWPPSPARLFAALVAADGTGRHCTVTDGSELEWLESAGAPELIADDRDDVLVSPVTPRYVVDDQRAAGTVQDYPARKATMVRPGVRVCPRRPRVVYEWPDATPPAHVVEGLQRRAARVGYLGCADSPVRMRVATTPTNPMEEDDAPAGAARSAASRRWRVGEQGMDVLPVPWQGSLAVLDDAYERWRAGQPVRRAWLPTGHARYTAPHTRRDDADETWAGVWLRLRPALDGRRVRLVTETLRAAVLEHYERHVAGASEQVPAALHGHGYTGTGLDHAYWLALPDVGHRHARGRILGAAVALPPAARLGVSADERAHLLEGLRSALWHVRELVAPGAFRVQVEPAGAAGQRVWSTHPRRWTQPARRWASVFPVVHERFTGKGLDLDEVARWCAHAGLPAPVGFRASRPPLVPGGVALRAHEARRNAAGRRPFTHVEVTFAEPVAGPMALGRLRHFGVGLMAPVDDTPNPDTTVTAQEVGQ